MITIIGLVIFFGVVFAAMYVVDATVW